MKRKKLYLYAACARVGLDRADPAIQKLIYVDYLNEDTIDQLMAPYKRDNEDLNLAPEISEAFDILEKSTAEEDFKAMDEKIQETVKNLSLDSSQAAKLGALVCKFGSIFASKMGIEEPTDLPQ